MRSVGAEEWIPVCYGYGCLIETEIRLVDKDWQPIAARMVATVDAVSERESLALVIGRLYSLAGEQTPIHNDRGGNYADEGVFGAMDCIDHATTTTRFLRAIERHGLLRWHRVLPKDVRSSFFVFEHYSAVIEEIPLLPEEPAARFAVDSWFVDHGLPAVILPLEDWKKGAGPDV